MSELTPITRVESYLDAIVNSGIPPTEDITRIETFLQAIYDNQVCALTPITRIEMFLGKISGQDIVLPEPITRIELYLAAIAGEDVELPENPITRIEMYLADWADSGDWTTISGAIVEFITQRAHKLKSCVVSLSPKQDLHGYDSPWPGGGGKNIVPFDQVMEDGWTTTMNGVTATYHNGVMHIEGRHTSSGWTNIVNLTPWVYNRFQLPSGVTLRTAVEPANTAALTMYGAVDNVPINLSNGSQIPEGSVATISGFYIAVHGEHDFNFDMPLIVTTGDTRPTTFSPYSNICPISGWTGCEVFARGHNMWDEETRKGYYSSVTGDFVNDGSSTMANKNPVSVKPSTTYYFKSGSYTLVLFFYDKSMHFISALSGKTNNTFTTPSNCAFVNFCNAYGSGETYNHDISINYPSTDTEYHAYNGNSYSVTFGETVYGATPDIVSGEMPVNRGIKDLGDEDITWYKVENNNYANFFTNYFQDKTIYNANIPTIICSQYKPVANNTALASDDNYVWVNPQKVIRLKDTSKADLTVEQFKAAMRGVQLCYELANPVETAITPTPITALKGYNAMWSDGGDIEVTVHGTPVEVETLQALNMLLGGAYRNNQTADDVSDEEALDIILGGEQR